MWDGTVLFYRKLGQGEPSALTVFMEQANEHRVLWTKILFWVDYQFNGAMNSFLIAVNLALMVALWTALALAAKRLAGANRRAAFLAAMVVALPCFSWLQAENITWGYQSQFFLAYLLPLLALICMSRWIRDGREVWFASAILLGMAATVSMANGLLALPLLVVMLVVNLRLSVTRLLTLAGITAATIALWFHNYKVAHHPSAQAWEKVKLILTFLGAPGHFLFQSEWLGFGFGIAVIASMAYFAWVWAVGKTRDPLFSALFLFLLYVCAAAVAVAQGRPFDDYHMTLTSRYETPVMLAYAAIVLMFMHLGRDRAGTPAALATLLVAMTVIFLPTQTRAIGPEGPAQVAQRLQAAQALNLGVRDTEATKAVYPADTPAQVTNVLMRAKWALDANLGIFGMAPLRAARSAMGKTPDAAGLERCEGNLDVLQPIADDPGFQRMHGWAFDAAAQRVPPVAFVVANGVVAGTALTGVPRADVELVKPLAVGAGFSGYVQAGVAGGQIYCEKSR